MAQESDDKLDRTGEFFCIGSPLHAVRAGYVKRRADDLLYEAKRGGAAVLVSQDSSLVPPKKTAYSSKEIAE